MPLLKKWIENGALFAIWRVEETAEELRKMLVASLPYDEELSQLKSEARQLEYLAVRVLLRAVCGEEKHISHYSSGKPFLTDGSFHITISHTRGYVAVGLHATYEVGVDIEYISIVFGKLPVGICIRTNFAIHPIQLICLSSGRQKKPCISCSMNKELIFWSIFVLFHSSFRRTADVRGTSCELLYKFILIYII